LEAPGGQLVQGQLEVHELIAAHDQLGDGGQIGPGLGGCGVVISSGLASPLNTWLADRGRPGC
jgi:hypothetical protein